LRIKELRMGKILVAQQTGTGSMPEGSLQHLY
jgi:hypothetical protein